MARRTTKPYDDKTNPIWYCPQTQSSWYNGTSKGSYIPVGILLHDTGCNNDMLKRYVQPSDNAPDKALWLERLGKGWGTDWNHQKVDAGLNYWVGRLANGQVTSIGAGKDADDSATRRAWGCASGSNGSCNGMRVYNPNTGKICNGVWVQWEICEDNKHNESYYFDKSVTKNYFNEVWEESVALAAYLCKRYNINPLGTVKTASGLIVPTINCHWQSYLQRLGSGHYDIFDWTDIQMGKTNHDNVFQDAIMQKFRNDVATAMGKQPQPEPTPTPTPTPTPSHYPDVPFLVQVKYPVTYYDKPNGKGLGSVQKGTYTITQLSGDYGKLKSGIGWLYLKDAGIYIKGGDEDMKFTDLKECYYRQGNIITGDPVRVIQSVVKPIDGVDGSFGPNTRDAVIRFQKTNGLNPDGIVGAKTWEKIYSKCE